MPTTIEATYRVTTPMFCSGADQTKAELRLPSFKGVLRFWWRALAWSRYGGDLEMIRQQEDALFGSAEGGQSLVSMRLEQRKELHILPGKDLNGQGARYLAYGLTEGGKDQRSALRPPFDFTVHMRMCNPEGDLTLLREALIVLGTIGGMGARSRKGFGSVSLETLRVDAAEQEEPTSMTDLRETITALKGRCNLARNPPYTAVSKDSRFLLVTGQRTSLALIDDIGLEYKQAMRSLSVGERDAFGLPRKRKTDRRASPLFIHIHVCADKPVAVLSFLPAQFLPNRDVDYNPVLQLLQRLRNGRLRAEEIGP